MKYFWLTVLMVAVLSPALAGEVSVMPSRIEVALPPGGDHTQLLRVFYGKDDTADTEPLRFVLSTEDWGQSLDGRIHFDKGNPQENSARPWVIFSPREQEIVPGEVGEIRLSVIVPEDAQPGEHRAALIIQPRTPYRPIQAGEKRLDLKLRLSTIIYVSVTPVEPRIELTDLDVARTKDGWKVEPTFLNDGQVHIRLVDSYEIFRVESLDETPRDLVFQSIEEESGVVLPGDRRRLHRPIPPFTLGPGMYQLVYRVDPGRDLAILEGERVFEIPGDVTAPVASVDLER